MTRLHELAEEYLSGNVREKLAAAEEAAKHNPNYKRNVEALRKVQPIDLTEKDIMVTVGAPWVDVQYYNQFLLHILGAAHGCHIEYNKNLGKWSVEGNAHWWGSEFRKWTVQKAKVGEVNFFELLEMVLSKKTPSFTTDKKPDEATNAEARAKVEQINAAFADWIWADDSRKADLLETYNAEFNSNVLRNYDGSRLTFPGLASHIQLRPHQKDVIWRIMQGQNTLIAHCVGAGKTWEMVVSAMEMKRPGLIRKPLFVLPQNLLRQLAIDFRKVYPLAKLLLLEAEDLPGAKIKIGFDERLDTVKHKNPKEAEAAEGKTFGETAGNTLANRDGGLGRNYHQSQSF